MNNRFWIVLLLVALVCAFLGLGRGDVVTDNEGQRAAPPATMLRTGDYVIPRLNGEPYLVKPPLLYWAIAAVYSVAGVSEFTARIPTALAGVALVVCLYLVMRKEAGEKAARWAALALLASPYVFERLRWAELDIPLTLAMFLSIAAARKATLSESVPAAWKYVLLSGIAFGAAVMLKGPVPFLFFWASIVAILSIRSSKLSRIIYIGIRVSIGALLVQFALTALKFERAPVLLVFVMGTWTVLALRYTTVPKARLVYWLAAAGIGVLLALPWGIAVLRQQGWDYIRGMLDSQVVERTYTASAINGGWPLYYAIAIAFMLAPWGFLLPFQFAPREWNRQNDLYRFSVLMSWLSLLTFSLIAGKEYEYILPSVPFMLLATGYHLAQIGSGIPPAWIESWARRWQIGVLVMLAVVCPAGAVYFTAEHGSPGLLALVWLLAIVALCASVLAIKGRTYRNAGIFIGAMCALLMFLNGRGDANQGDRSPQSIAKLAAEYARAGYTVEASKVYPAFDFYAGITIPLNQSPEDVQKKFAGDAPYLYLTRKGLLGMTGLRNYNVVAGPIEFKDLVLISNQEAPLPNATDTTGP